MVAMACLAPLGTLQQTTTAARRTNMICSSSSNVENSGLLGMCTGRRRALIFSGILLGLQMERRAEADQSFETYYGTAASASSYGGYGGNASKKDSAEYVFEVPQGWKERLISKVEKGTNGTDSEFYNPKKKSEKTYLTYLAGFRKLAPRDTVLNNLSLSDVNLQDDIMQAENITSSDRKDDSGQVYYEYEIQGPAAHSLISVTCARNKLYAHFVKAPSQDWKRDEQMLRHIHESFTTVGISS